MGLLRKQKQKQSAIPQQTSDIKPLIAITDPTSLEDSSGDLGESFAKVVENLFDDDKIWYATEFQDLEELRYISVLWVMAKQYKIPLLEMYIKTYLIAKTSYKRKRTKEALDMVKGARRDLETFSSKFGSLFKPRAM